MILAPKIDEFWLKVAPLIEQIRVDQSQPWQLADVYSALLAKLAFLYASDDGESFAIVKPKVDRFSGENVLFVWLAGGMNGKRSENTEMLMELARGIGATRLEMESTRRGFERTGWDIKHVTYSMNVTEA